MFLEGCFEVVLRLVSELVLRLFEGPFEGIF